MKDKFEVNRYHRNMNICFITYRYPGKHNTSDFAFVKQLVDAIASLGHHCLVLAPFNISHYKRLSVPVEEYEVNKGTVTVFRPGYLSFSNFHIGKFRPSSWSHKNALKRAFRMLSIKPDAIYGHFWGSAYDGYEYAKKNNIPLFVATGESEISKLFSPKVDQKDFSEYVSGVICVSSKNKDESVSLGLTINEKCKVFPNSVNAGLFRKMDKWQCREQLGLPQDVFIIAFVGWFIERKGTLRVSEAIKQIEGKKVYSLFIGKGDQVPDCDNILFKGALPHEEVPLYLNAADVFVLPTLHEGCCNAVVEAMACGLPVISSDLPFNWDVLNKGNSIMVNPNSINEIRDAIVEMRDNNVKRMQLSQGSLKSVQDLTIENRAQAIVEFINSRINNK